MTWLLAGICAAFLLGLGIADESRIRRNTRCTKAAQERLEREIAERGER